MGNTITFLNGQQVCRLGQGTWAMGQNRAKRKEEIATLRHGVELGLNLIDTAELYDNEELVGEAVRGIRDKVFLVSKVLPSKADYKGTIASCERSIRRLGVDCIDLYLLHWIGKYPFEETVRAMQRIQQNGKIRMWGMSNLDVCHLETLPDIEQCATDQVLYNLSDRGVEYDLIPWCQQRNMPVMAYTPMGSGKLLKSKILQEIAERHNATPAQIALAWTMRLGGIIAIPKAGTIAHVDDNFKSLNIELTPQDLADLDSAFPPPTHKIPLAGW